MKLELKSLPGSKIEIEAEVPVEDFEHAFQKTLLGLAKNLQTQGFRKGKLPPEIALKKIGDDTVLTEAARRTIEKTYQETVFKRKLEPISSPAVEILKLARQNPFCFRITFVVLPEICLPNYKKISSKIEREKISVKNSEIKESLVWLQKSRPKFKIVNRPAQKEDFVEVEFSCPKIGAGKKQKDAFLLGKGHFIPNFEENLEKMKPGQEKEFELTFPQKHFINDLAGQKAEFKVMLNSVKEVTFPEINDQFARELGRFENLAALKRSIKEGLRAEKERAEAQKIRALILEKIRTFSKFDTPEILIELEKQRMLDDLKTKIAKTPRLSFEEYLAKIKKSEKELIDSFSEEAFKRAKNFLILREIAKRENIVVSEEEVKEGVNEILKSYPYQETGKGLDLEKLKAYTEERMKEEKTLAKLESFVSSKFLKKAK